VLARRPRHIYNTCPHDQGQEPGPGCHLDLAHGHMGAHTTRGPKKRGVTQYFPKNLFLIFIIRYFNDFKPDFGGFLPIFEDLEPRLRPYFGRKLGCDPQIKFYINKVQQENDFKF
jgi:hypothetical protein